MVNALFERNQCCLCNNLPLRKRVCATCQSNFCEHCLADHLNNKSDECAVCLAKFVPEFVNLQFKKLHDDKDIQLHIMHKLGIKIRCHSYSDGCEHLSSPMEVAEYVDEAH